MSATINKFCSIINLPSIHSILFPQIKSHKSFYKDPEYENRWNWDTSELIIDAEDKQDNSWLAECLIAISPLVDLLVIGKNQQLVVCNFEDDSSDNVNSKFNMLNNIDLQDLNKEEELSSIVLLPFVPHLKISANFHDWTAIVAGFSSGFLRIYKENGQMLISHIFHNEPILDIKCRTYITNKLLADQVDELLVIYPTAVILIDGISLYKTLQISNNSQDSLNSSKDMNDKNQTFTFKKWCFNTSSDGQIVDCVNVCSYVKNDFDALVSHSINNQPLNNEPANLFFATGTNPYVSFYRTQEGASHTILNEISQAFVYNIKNVFSFLNQSRSTEIDPLERIKPATVVEPSLTLFDERLGQNIYLSPNRRLAAVVDGFGRVILFDIQNAVAVRIWKGYRKAQVGWMVIEEENDNQEHCKQAHFLVIYAPKKGLLEIWLAQNGPRVEVFNVGKKCKLLYTDHTIFGLNDLVIHNLKQKIPDSDFRKVFTYSKCLLLNYQTGELFNIDVPFLCALTDRNSQKARDIYILKDIKTLLKDYQNTDNYQDILSLVLMIKTVEIRLEFLKNLIKLSNDPQLIFLCANNIRIELQKNIDKNELDFENKLIAQMCARIEQICQYFMNIKVQHSKLMDKVNNLVQESNNPPDIHKLAENLVGWSGNDSVRIISLLAFRQSVLNSSIQNNIMEELDNKMKISDILSHFTLYYSHLVKKNNVEIYEKLPIEIVLMNRQNDDGTDTNSSSNNSSHVILDKLSLFLFYPTFCGDAGNLDILLNDLCIYPSNLLLLMFTAWLNSSFSNYWPCWENFSKALFDIVDIINDTDKSDDSNTDNLFFNSSILEDRLLAPSWADIIELIYRSTNITSALISVNMIKSLINRFKLNSKDISQLNLNDKALSDQEDNETSSKDEIVSNNSTISAENEWETLHLDKENLNMLTKQFEDLFLLDMLLKSNFSSISSEHSQNIFPNNLLTTINKDSDYPIASKQISLSFILSSGPDIVSKIVACWAFYQKIDPELLTTIPDSDSSPPDVPNENEDSILIAKQHNPFNIIFEKGTPAISKLSEMKDRSTLMEILDHVRRCFPNCLEPDVLLLNCGWEVLQHWYFAPTIFSIELHKSLTYLDKVSSCVFKHNVAFMSWRLFIQRRFEILCNLIMKMGKKPKDRICRKELEMDENNLEQFITFCCDLLDFIIRTYYSSELEPLPIYSIDDWWCGFNASNYYSCDLQNFDGSTASEQIQKFSIEKKFASNIPLAVLAMHQKTANFDFLVIHYQLALATQFIVMFSVRNTKLLSLFPSSVSSYFFKDLYSCSNIVLISDSENLNANSPDPVLSKARYDFLFDVITAIVETLPVYRNENEWNEAGKFYLVANKWFSKVVLLTREWNLDIDRVRLRYVYDLFLYGCDPLAHELISTVTNVSTLARELLAIAGMRLLSLINTRYLTPDEVSILSPKIIFWLKSLVTNPNCNTDIPHSSTILLLEKISLFFGDDTASLKICEEMLNAEKVLTGS